VTKPDANIPLFCGTTQVAAAKTLVLLAPGWLLELRVARDRFSDG